MGEQLQQVVSGPDQGRSFANEEWRNRGVPDLSNSVSARRASRRAMVALGMILQSVRLKRL
jgi:hypothetical protein